MLYGTSFTTRGWRASSCFADASFSRFHKGFCKILNCKLEKTARKTRTLSTQDSASANSMECARGSLLSSDFCSGQHFMHQPKHAQVVRGRQPCFPKSHKLHDWIDFKARHHYWCTGIPDTTLLGPNLYQSGKCKNRVGSNYVPAVLISCADDLVWSLRTKYCPHYARRSWELAHLMDGSC